MSPDRFPSGKLQKRNILKEWFPKEYLLIR
jgi:hypothetical protein